MEHIFNHATPYNYNWSESLKNYQNKYSTSPYQSQSQYQGQYQGYPQRVTQSSILKNDNIFNPILQTYTDKNKEKQLREQEKSNIISTIIRNQDNALKTQQTFNIINLRDKLKGLENDKNYPRKNIQKFTGDAKANFLNNVKEVEIIYL